MNSYIRRTIRDLVHPRNRLAIDSRFWRTFLLELHGRGPGSGRVESGAFLLGMERNGRRTCVDAVYYDDLDPHCLDSGAILFRSEGYAELWRRCRQMHCKVVADVHTHPGIGRQSPLDAQHPMIFEIGHVALVVPDLARDFVTAPDVGTYVYAGALTWTHSPRALYVGRLAN